jgi:hypothetical protein
MEKREKKEQKEYLKKIMANIIPYLVKFLNTSNNLYTLQVR